MIDSVTLLWLFDTVPGPSSPRAEQMQWTTVQGKLTNAHL